MSRVRYVLLAEDIGHIRFVRSLLKGIKGDYYESRIQLSPPSKGSAEQFVRMTFPFEVEAFRSKNYQPKLGLIAVIDADELETRDRIEQLNRSLTEVGLAPVQGDEAILLIIPKRCVETWVVHLMHGHADETKPCQTYKYQSDQKDYPSAAKTFANEFRNPPENWLPGMKQCAADLTAWHEKLS